MSELSEALKDLLKKAAQMTIRRGTVVSVDTAQDTCVVAPSDGGAEFKDVKLQSIIKDPTSSSSRFIIYPKVDTEVLIGKVHNDGNDAFVVSVSEFDSVLIELNPDFLFNIKSNGQVDLKSPKIVINDGTLGGLLKLADTVDHLNTIQADINQLKNIFAGWVIVPSDGGAALKAAAASWAGSPLTPTTTADLENIKIKQ